MAKSIYDLKLHEELSLPGTNTKTNIVKRVPGGWIYEAIVTAYVADTVSISSSSVFVPLNNVFDPTDGTSVTTSRK